MSDQTSSNEPAPAQDSATGPKPKSKVVGWIQKIVAVVMFLVLGLIIVGKIITAGDLPGCDSKVTKDRLSANNAKNQVNATHYIEIKTLNKSDTEIACFASLALKAGGTLELDYKVVREGETDSALIITKFERKP